VSSKIYFAHTCPLSIYPIFEVISRKKFQSERKTYNPKAVLPPVMGYEGTGCFSISSGVLIPGEFIKPDAFLYRGEGTECLNVHPSHADYELSEQFFLSWVWVLIIFE
jgi:hypothetical protein